MILNRQRRVRVRPAELEEFLSRVRRTVGAPDDSVSICLVSDAAMAQMNKRFRGKNGPTDVLSFPANGTERKERRERKDRIQNKRRKLPAGSSSSSTSSPCFPYFFGDIAISPETAQRNARRFGRRVQDELCILILHGVLHLLGYDHEADHGEMERLELRLRRELGIDTP